MTSLCRSCGGSDLEVFLSLGRTPLANSLPKPEQIGQPEVRYPLDVAICARCSLVQILETVPPEMLFSEYLYFSSFSTTMVEEMRRLSERLIAEHRLGPGSFVAEIASNDGYLLQWYAKRGIPVLGIEPARNIAKVALERGIRTESLFFSAKEASRIAAQGLADIIHANNVLAHVAGLNDVVEGIARLLKPAGVAVVEVPYVRDLVEHLEFDTIYHEHLCYFSLTALVQLVGRHGLAVSNVERIPLHGGSLRLFITHTSADRSGASVKALLTREEADGLTEASYYRGFSDRVSRLREELRALLLGLKGSGKRIAAYGASAKGSTLLNTFDLGTDVLDFVVDRNPHKQGRVMPGVHVPVLAPEALLERMPDYVVLLTWNFADEILAQQTEYRQRGGKFVVPVPQPKVL